MPGHAVPGLARERAAWARGRLLFGIDEVGRGPLAGPVVAAVVAFPPSSKRILGLRDSKVLTAIQRNRLAVLIRNRAATVGIGAASCRVIDRVNIRVATAIAMRRALRRAAGECGAPMAVLIDGLPLPELRVEQDGLVDGDALCYSIAAAGVIAKVVRDKLMMLLARRHPTYGWETNMGYGTPEHLAAIDLAGPTVHHRKSFMPVAQLK